MSRFTSVSAKAFGLPWTDRCFVDANNVDLKGGRGATGIEPSEVIESHSTERSRPESILRRYPEEKPKTNRAPGSQPLQPVLCGTKNTHKVFRAKPTFIAVCHCVDDGFRLHGTGRRSPLRPATSWKMTVSNQWSLKVSRVGMDISKRFSTHGPHRWRVSSRTTLHRSMHSQRYRVSSEALQFSEVHTESNLVRRSAEMTNSSETRGALR